MSMNEQMNHAEESILHTYNRFPVMFDHGEGCDLYDTEGKKYLDFAAGIVERWIFQLCTVSGSGGAAARNDSAAVGAVGAQAGGAHHDRQLCGALWQPVL